MEMVVKTEIIERKIINCANVWFMEKINKIGESSDASKNKREKKQANNLRNERKDDTIFSIRM